ncbi:MAG: MdtA/MuxA family multidrug efflux RND transporter periplasmic adaptor subunit [Alphaproteobacteria bacterium]|nr:MdtA/MuxA family multidrug efflux RND transporter periplasmic adaptor subunit [Alphaproteobacteria bacterium]
MNDQNPRTDERAPPTLSRETRRPRRRAWIQLLVLAVILGTAGAVVWWAQTRPQTEAPRGRFGAGQPVPVVVAPALREDVPRTLNALGTVTPFAIVTVKTQVAGPLMRIAFEEGQVVAKGDLLAEIDPRPFQHALEQAQGQLARDMALLRNAEVDLARYRTLAEQNSIARQQLDTQLALVQQYQGIVKTDQALVNNAALNLTYCRILAPMGGRVGLRLVDAGNYVQTNDPGGIVVITQVRPITVLFSVPEDNLPLIIKRLQSGSVLPVTAFDRGRKAKLAAGWLTTVDNQMDVATGTVKLKAQFDNADEALFPNQFVNLEIVVDMLSAQTVIPVAAVQRGAPGTYVYLVKADNIVGVQKVELGVQDGQRVAILSGLAPGDRVVVDGVDRLRDGAKIMLPGQRGGDGRPTRER